LRKLAQVLDAGDGWHGRRIPLEFAACSRPLPSCSARSRSTSSSSR
jgi:hypothetical protein